MKILAKIALAGLAALALVGSLVVAQPASAAPFHHNEIGASGKYGSASHHHHHHHHHHKGVFWGHH